jgi:predicted nucleotidyltransferase
VPDTEPTFTDIERTLKRSVAALRDSDVAFLLAGSLASWARGGPETRHDLDFIVKPEDGERALEALVEADMRPERPPEEWLLKAWDGDVLVDLIFAPQGLRVGDELLARGDEMSVMGITVPVMALEDLLVTKLLALSDHSLDYESLLLIARALREQIDWQALRARTEHSPYAKAFFVLAEELGVTDRAPRAAGDKQIRVVP